MIDIFFSRMCCENWANIFHQQMKNTETTQKTTQQCDGSPVVHRAGAV